MKDDNYFLNLAIDLAVENVKNGHGGPFAAVVVKNGEIIATGVNSVTEENDPTAHAEVKAIRNACQKLDDFQLSDCTIYSSCEPCPMCLGAVYWSRPARLVFAASKEDAARAGFDDDFIYREIEKPLNMRELETKNLKLDNKNLPFKIWQSSQQKIDY